MARILGIDLGDNRIGLALCDPSQIIAHPLSSINRDSALSELPSLIKIHEVALIIVGLPLELDGKVGTQAKKVKNFMKKLNRIIAKNNLSCEIKEWDERFSSVQADMILIGSGLENANRSAARDRISATIILQSYLEFINNQP